MEMPLKMSDTNSLSRFLDAQRRDYPIAMAEIKSGRKQSHWMWYIFPQVAGLGLSGMSMRYAIKDLAEAKAYLAHPVLGNRLKEISSELLKLTTSNATEVFGTPDDLKLRSCMTLFLLADPAESIFKGVLEKYFGGRMDAGTVALVQS